MNGIEIIVLTAGGLDCARRIKRAIGGEICGPAGKGLAVDREFSDLRAHLNSSFANGATIVGVMASGALIRLLAPALADKHMEPPVIAVAEDGSSAVPLLGGHNGANDLARSIASALDGHAAVTTAGDLRFGIALDAPPSGWVLGNPENAKAAMAALLDGEQARLEGPQASLATWLSESGLPLADSGKVRLLVSDAELGCGPLDLLYYPMTHVIGLGCERGTEAGEVAGLVEQAIATANISPKAIAALATIDLKADEAALNALAGHMNLPLRLFDSASLEEQTPRLAHPSDIVFQEVGCHGVAEGAALAAAGSSGELVLPKTKSKRATVAIARASAPIDPSETGRTQGRLFVVGIGPGKADWRSPEVTRMISAASDLVGYSLYLDIVSELSHGKVRHDFDLGREEDRVRHAMELAGTGKDVALVCSGDAGIYAMATLVFELLADGGLSDGARRIAIEVSPGISALQAAAARAGAPLGHDFCTISLSDLLTPWEAIKRRVKAAAEGDFVIAFYNPVSKRRRTQLAYAKEVLLTHRPADTPVILATNLGRKGERVRVVSLADLQVDDVDMLTVVVVGSSQTRTVRAGDGKLWTYTPRGYADKEGTKIASEAAQ